MLTGGAGLTSCGPALAGAVLEDAPCARLRPPGGHHLSVPPSWVSTGLMAPLASQWG